MKSLKTPLGIILTAATLSIATATHAQYVGPSEEQSNHSVAQILKDPVDDQKVQLQGHLLRQKSAEKYVFSDGTAEILVEIDKDEFHGLPPINEHTQVEIQGEVDTSRHRAPEIEVDRIRIIQ